MKTRSVLIILVILISVSLLVRSCFFNDTAVQEEETALSPVETMDESATAVSPPKTEEREEREEREEADPAPETPPRSPDQLMVGIVHSVGDKDIWVNSYYRASEESNRVAIYQNMDIPGHIFVLEKISRERIKEKMDAGSVNYFFNVEYQEEETELEQFCIAVYYEMEDFEKWKEIFASEELVNIRKEAGLKVWAYARGYTDPNMIYLLFTTTDLEPIYDLIDLNAFKRAYEDAGVLKDPELHFLELIPPPKSE